MKHSRLSPSAAHRWMNCPGSVALQSRAPHPPTSKFAALGSAAHKLAEKALLKNCAPDHLDVFEGNRIYGSFVVDDNMISAVAVYLDEVYRLRNKHPDAANRIECKLKLPGTEIFGTADFVLHSGSDLYIVDYKHGENVVVEVGDNPQLLIYALMAWRELGGIHDSIYTVVVQPRAEHKDGPVRRHWYSADQIKDFEIRLNTAIDLIKTSPDLCIPGDWCGWCPGAGICPEATKEIDDLIFEPIVDDLARCLHILESEKLIKAALKAAREFVLSAGIDGKETPGMKVVQSWGNRTWKLPESEIESALIRLGARDSEIWQRRLISPAAAQKMVGKAAVDEYVTREDKGPALVSASSKQREYKPEVTFDAINDDDRG